MSALTRMLHEIGSDLRWFLESHGAVVTQKTRGAAGDAELRSWDALHPELRLPRDYALFLSCSNGVDMRWVIRRDAGASSVARVAGTGAGKIHLNSLKDLAVVTIDDPTLVEAFDDSDADPSIAAAASTTAASSSAASSASGGAAAAATIATAGALPLPLHGVRIDAGDEGVVALVYRPRLRCYQVWFQDLACMWHFAADSFTNYMRLAIMHAGVLHWRYIFAPIGLDPTTAQWIRWLLPERFAVDDEWRVAKKNAALDALR